MAQNFLTGINIVGDALSISGTSAISSARHFAATSITASSSTNRSIILDYTGGSGSYTWASFKQSGTEQFRIWGDYTSNYLSFYNDQASVHQLKLNSDGSTTFGGNVSVNAAGQKAVLHVKNEGNNWEDGVLLEHDSGDTGWNIHPENNSDNALWFGYNSDTSVALTSQGATAALKLNSDLSATFEGDLYVPNKLIHVGDTNTWIQFETDVISLRTGGTDRLTLTDSAATFEGKIIAGDSGGTNGSVLLQQTYSGNDIISTIGTMYSSGGLILGYGIAPKSGSSGFISTADNANFQRAYMLLDNNEFTIGYAAAQTTTVGSDITGLTTPFTLDITSGNATFGGTITSGSITATGAGNTDISSVSTGDWASLTVKSSDAASAYIFLKDASGERARLQSTSNNNLKFLTNGGGSLALTLDSSTNATFEGNIITESGTVLVGGSTGQATSSGTGTLQVLGTGHSDSLFTIAKFKADATAPSINFLKSRHATIGSNTIVQDDDNLGEIVFAAADGNDFTSYAAKIMAEVDGTPGQDDMPGRIGFYTTADGAAAPTLALTLDKSQNATFAGNIRTTADIGRDDHNRIMFSTDDSLIYRVADSHRFRMNSDNFSPYVDSSYDLGTSSLYFRHAYIDAITTTGNVDAANFKISGAQGSDGQVLTSTGSGVAWEDSSASFSGGTVANAILLPDGGASAPSIGNTGDTNTGMYWPADHQVGFTVNNSRKFYMSETRAFFQNLSSGVQIDSSSDAPLEVKSSDATTGIKFTDNNANAKLYYVGSGNYFYTDAHRLGIGDVAAPSVALHVVGTDNLSSRFIFTKDTSTDKILWGGADHDTFGAPFIGSSSAHSFTITQGGGAAITIDTSKNAYFEGLIVANSVGTDKQIQFNRTGGNTFSIEHDTSQIYFWNETTSVAPLKFSNASDATFAGNITFGDSHLIGDDGDDNLLIQSSAGENIYIDSADDIILDAAGSDIKFNVGTTHFGTIKNDSSHLIIEAATADKDIIFRGTDGSTETDALRLDMSNGGSATFLDDVDIGKNLNLISASSPTIQVKDTTNNSILKMYAQNSNAIIGTYSNHPLAFYTDSGATLTLNTDHTVLFASTVETSGVFAAGNGAVGAPAFTFASDLNTGMYRVGADSIGFATGGSLALTIADNAATFAGNVGIGATADSTYSLLVQAPDEDIVKIHNSTDGLDSLISFTNPGGTLGRIQGLDNGGLQFDTGNNAGGLNTNALNLSNAGNAAFSGDVGMATGHSSGKFAVMSSSVHGSYDLYNNGTTYLNGAVTVDAAFTQSGNAASSFSGSVDIGTFTIASSGIVADAGMTLQIGGGSVNAITLADSTGNATFAGEIYSGGKLGVGTTDPNTDGYSFAEDLVIKGGNSASDGAGITIACNGKTYGVLAFGDAADNNIGEIYYSHGDNSMSFRTNTNVGLRIDSSSVATFTGYIHLNGIVNATGTGGEIGRNHAYDTLELKAYGAELMIGGQSTSLHVNYRTCNNGTSSHTPTQWYWRAGSSSSFSNHDFGNVKANGNFTATGYAYLGGETTDYITMDGNYFQVQTADGYTKIGAANSSWSHFYTDRAKYYFNTQITVDGGVIGSYDENIEIKRASTLIMTGNGSGYLQPNTWIQFSGGGYGLYSATNGAHFYPNNGTSTYATWGISGSRNGYYGILMGNITNKPHVMYDGSGNGGGYHEGSNQWAYYWHVGNACMGIATSTTSSSYAAYVEGSLMATADIVAYSDKRAKENIVTVDNALNKVSNLRGVYYNKKDSDEKKREVGVIAQEVKEVLPEVVTYDKENDQYGVDYGKINGLLIEAIKDLKKEIEELKQCKKCTDCDCNN